MHHLIAPFPLRGMLPSSLLSLDIYTTSTYLKSLPVLYSPPYDILSIHTFHIPHIILSPLLYTTLALVGMPH